MPQSFTSEGTLFTYMIMKDKMLEEAKKLKAKAFMNLE